LGIAPHPNPLRRRSRVGEINLPEVINLIKRIPNENLSPSVNDDATRILRLLHFVRNDNLIKTGTGC
jgi:hypothetical protein